MQYFQKHRWNEPALLSPVVRVDHGEHARIVAPVGSQVEAKDLLIELQAPEPGTDTKGP